MIKMKNLLKNIARIVSLLAYIACVVVILVESGVDGKNSADQSNGVADQIQDSIDKNHDKNTIKEIQDFSIEFTGRKDGDIYSVGDSLSYDFSYSPSDTSFKELKWEIVNKDVVHLDESSRCLSFVNSGSSKVLVSSQRNESLKKEFFFVVNTIPVTSIRLLDYPSSSMNIGEDSLPVQVEVLPLNATDRSVIYSSSDTSVLTISSSGIVSAKSSGTAVITVSSVSNPEVSVSFSVLVNKPDETHYDVTSIAVIQPSTVLTSKETSLTVSGSYEDVSADFDVDKLRIDIKDSNHYIDIKNKRVVSRGKFSFQVVLSASDIAEKNNLADYQIPLEVSYSGLDSKESISVILSKLKELRKSDLKNVDTSKRNLKYTHYRAYGNETDLSKDTIQISLSYNVNLKRYDSTKYRWMILNADGVSDYPLSTYFKKTEAYNSIKLVPNSSMLPLSGIIRYVPNTEHSDEFLDIPFEYSSYVDDSSRIIDFGFTKLFGNDKKTEFFVEDGNKYGHILDTSITVSASAPSSVKTSLMNSKLDMVLEDNGIASFVDDDIGNHIGLRFLKAGETTLTLSSSLAKDIQPKVYHLVSSDMPNQAYLTLDGERIDSDTVSINKNQKKVFDVVSSFDSSFCDGSSISVPLSSTLSWSHEKKDETNLIFVDSTHTIQGLKQDTADQSVSISFSLSFNGKDISSLLKYRTIHVKVNYIPIDRNIFGFFLSSSQVVNEYNSPSQDFSTIPLGTVFSAVPSINSDATNSSVSLTVDHPEILEIDGLFCKAIKTGKVRMTLTSLDDLSISKTKDIRIVDTVSPFVLDMDKIKPISFTEHKGKNDLVESYDLSLDYGISYQVYIRPLVSSTSKTLTFRHLDNEKKTHAVGIDKSGRITTNSIGKDQIEVIYGDSTSSHHYSLVLNFDVVRNTKYSFQELKKIVRKSLGHFGLFMVTALIGAWFILFMFSKTRWRLLACAVSLVLGFSLAGFSELIQFYTPGRYCCWMDVGIDFSGYAAGIVFQVLVFLVIALIRYMVHRRKTRENKEDNI